MPPMMPTSMIVCGNMVRLLAYHSRFNIYPLFFVLGLDDLLSKHISHLFIRDPIVIFSELIDIDDNTSTDHFEVRPCNSVSPGLASS